MNMKLVSVLKKYFQQKRFMGLCGFVGSQGGEQCLELLRLFAKKWPYSIKYKDGALNAYFIPASKTERSEYEAYYSYNNTEDMRKQEMRIEFANFILRKIGKIQKINFKPITLDQIEKVG